MALFKKNDDQPPKPRERVGAPKPQSDAAISIIAAGMNVVGDISTEGTVRVEGQVEGTIRAGKAVVLGQGGVVDGNIVTEDAVIGGRVSGSIRAANRIELQSTCSVEGEISTRSEHLKLEEGARFAGHVQMIEDQQIDVEADTGRYPEDSEDVDGPTGDELADSAFVVNDNQYDDELAELAELEEEEVEDEAAKT